MFASIRASRTNGKVCAILKRLFHFFIDEQLLNEPLRIERPKRLKAEIKSLHARAD
jgi:hypothetical protein